jgi:hypothetical protein
VLLVLLQDAEQKQGSRGEDEEQKGAEVALQFILRNFLRFFKYNLNANLSLNLFICVSSAGGHSLENLGCYNCTNIYFSVTDPNPVSGAFLSDPWIRDG